jgi:hypothetical protein
MEGIAVSKYVLKYLSKLTRPTVDLSKFFIRVKISAQNFRKLLSDGSIVL